MAQTLSYECGCGWKWQSKAHQQTFGVCPCGSVVEAETSPKQLELPLESDEELIYHCGCSCDLWAEDDDE